jgi:hypothetical protein
MLMTAGRAFLQREGVIIADACAPRFAECKFFASELAAGFHIR